MNFQTHYNKGVRHKEQNFEPSMVETAGYMSAQDRIENIIRAGERLILSRSEQYDFTDDNLDEDFEDPTRSKNFDLSDASNLSMAINYRLKAQEKLAYEKKALDAKQKEIQKVSELDKIIEK